MKDFSFTHDNTNAHITFNKERALENVLETAITYREGRLGGMRIPPQEDLPSTMTPSSYEHGTFLFTMASVDFVQRSDELFIPMRAALKSNPELLDPRRIIKVRDLQTYFESQGVRLSPTKKYESIRYNAQRLIDEGVDVRNIDALAQHDCTRATALVRNFKGMGHGTTPLFLRYMIDANMHHYDNKEELSIKVDTHKIKFPYQMGWFTTTHSRPWEIGLRRDKHALFLQDVYRELIVIAAQESSWRAYGDEDPHWSLHKSLDEGIWSLGSSVCSQSQFSVCQEQCGFFDECSGRPHLNSKSRKKKQKPPKEQAEHHTQKLFANKEHIGTILRVDEPLRTEVFFRDEHSGKIILSMQDVLYPFVDVREKDKEYVQLKLLS